MHDLDRTLQEFESGIDALESSDGYELEEEWEFESEGIDESEAVFDEVEEMELAAALLEIQDEEELDLFLGGLIKKVGRAAGKFVRSPVGRALGGTLKRVAKKALPIAGAALGNLVVPGAGGLVGGKLASMAGKMFGLELEGLSPQDQEFEIARRVVRLSGAAARHAAQAPASAPPAKVAKDAVLKAAKAHAPGLARDRTGQLWCEWYVRWPVGDAHGPVVPARASHRSDGRLSRDQRVAAALDGGAGSACAPDPAGPREALRPARDNGPGCCIFDGRASGDRDISGRWPS